MRVLCYDVQGLGGGLSQKTHRAVLAAFGGGAVARRVVEVSAWGSALASVIGTSELSLLTPPLPNSFSALFSQSGAGCWATK